MPKASRRGRPKSHWGDLEPKLVRLPVELKKLVEQTAAEVGTDTTDFIVRVLADHVGWKPAQPHQEPLIPIKADNQKAS